MIRIDKKDFKKINKKICQINALKNCVIYGNKRPNTLKPHIEEKVGESKINSKNNL